MRAVCLVALLLCAAPAFAEESLYASASVRNPRETHRIVAGDSIENPLDYQFLVGYLDNDGWARGSSEIGFERQNGRLYPTQEHRLRFLILATDIGFRLADLRDKQFYLATVYGEKKFLGGHVGVGFSRTWFARWFDAGTWMFRSSIGYDDLSVRRLSFAVNLTYETSRSRQHGSFYAEMRNVAFGDSGQYRIVPFARYEFVDDGRRVTGDVQGKVKFEVALK